MPTQTASFAKRPHSPSTSNSPPAKRRAHSPEEGEVDDGKPTSAPPARSPSSSPDADPDNGGGESRTRSTSPSQSHTDLGSSKNSKHAFPFANSTTTNDHHSHSSSSGERDRDRKRGDFYRPSSPRQRNSSSYNSYNHNPIRHAPGYDSYRPGAETDSYRPQYRRSRSRSRSRSRVDSVSPVARRHRLPPRPASPPPQPPLHSSYAATSYERSGGSGPYDRVNGGGYDRVNGGAHDRAGNGGQDRPTNGDRWTAPQPQWDRPNNANSNGRGRTRNPYADSGPSTRGATPNSTAMAGSGGLRPLDTPGAPAAAERVGVEVDANCLVEGAGSGRKEEGEEEDGAGPRDGKADSWEPRADRGRDGGRAWERNGDRDRERERGRDGSRGWGDRDRERGRNRERRQPPLPPPPNGSAPPPPPPPPPPSAPIDPKIEEALNDTIARVMREADEAEARKKEGGAGEKEAKEPGVKPKVLRRTAEQEMQAYGRKFVGTSQLRDYAISEKLGEGTFGEVHKASHIVSKRVVALKRILMHNEKEGVPVTALREIKILKMLSHPSVVTVCDMVVEAATRDRKGSIYMVFPYMDHDLAGLLENPSVKFSPSQIKLYMRQLLEGTEYLHQNKILHRDLKAANLLINNNGSLQIADFGLARPYSSTMPGWDPRNDTAEGPWDKLKGGPLKGGGGARYTNCVVTRWYRPPELLMGEARYGCAIDMWGVGCIMGEMWTRRPILCGSSDADQLEKIWELCGTPDEEVWPGWRELPGMDGVKPEIGRKLANRVRQFFSSSTSMDEHGVDLVFQLLTLNPATRITAFDALDHDYFWTEPLPCDPSSLPKYTSSHEYDKRKHKGEGVAPQMPMPSYPGAPMPGPGLGPGLGPGPGPGPGYPIPPPQQMPGHPPMMHGGPSFRPPGPWGGPGPGGPPFGPQMSGPGGRGGGRGFGRGGRGNQFHHHQRPPPNSGPNFNSGPGPGPGPGQGNASGPPINFSGYVRPGDGNASGGPGGGGPGGGGGGGNFLPPPLGTHSREHRQMRERNMRMNGHGPHGGGGPNGGGHRGGPPPRMGDFPPKPPVAPPPPNGNNEFLPYG